MRYRPIIDLATLLHPALRTILYSRITFLTFNQTEIMDYTGGAI